MELDNIIRGEIDKRGVMMKVYEWQETEHHHIAIIRPKELFDLLTVEKPSPQEQEVRLRAMHRLNNQMEGFSIAYSKEKGLEYAQKALEDAPDIYVERDMKDLERLAVKPSDGRLLIKPKKIELK